MNLLDTKTIQSLALALEGVDNVRGSDGLALGVFHVADRVFDDVLHENLQGLAGLLVNDAVHTLNAATTSEFTESGLVGGGNEVVGPDLLVALAGLADAFSRFAGHGDVIYELGANTA